MTLQLGRLFHMQYIFKITSIEGEYRMDKSERAFRSKGPTQVQEQYWENKYKTNKRTNYFKTKYFPSRNHRSTYLFKSCFKACNSLTKIFYFLFISGHVIIVVHFVYELITVIPFPSLVLQRL